MTWPSDGPSRTAPKTTNVTAPSAAPASSSICALSSARPRSKPPNTIPPTNAAMSPEPPIGVAIPYARAAPATGPIWSQAASTSACRRAVTMTAAAIAPASAPADEPVPDLLRDEPDGGAVADRALLGLGDGEGDEEDRHADPVVQPALDVEPLADP